MSEYMPTTGEVRLKYESSSLGQLPAAEFDRWLDRVRAEARCEGKAEAWDEAVASAYLRETEHFISIQHDPNPYRKADQ